MRGLNAAAAVGCDDRSLYVMPSRQPHLGTGIWRTLIYCSLFSLIFIPEFARDGVSEGGSIIYAKVAGGFRYVDLAILALAFAHLVCLACLRGKKLSLPRPLIAPGLAFVACIGIAAMYGKTHGGTNFFFDWRALALGVGVYVVWSFWVQNAADAASAVRLLAIYMAARIGLLYVLYIFGYRDTLLGVSIPVFDGPVISSIVFTGLLAFSFRDAAPNRRRRLARICLAAASALMVLLCMRRTYWSELGIGILLLTLLQKNHRARNLKIVALVIAVAALALGSALSSRLQSFDLSRDDSQFSADNADHVHDLLDAWNEVRQSPVMGIGLGTSYPTWHIRRWKAESVMVHNAPLHVWLKYGLAGLLCYLWFHLVLLLWLYRKARAPTAPLHPFLAAAFAYLAAQFVVTLGFAPWPYSELQLTALMAFVLAVVVATGKQQLFVRHA